VVSIQFAVRCIGLACGTEKGSYVAACVEVEIDLKQRRIIPHHVCQVFECCAIINPDDLRSRVEGHHHGTEPSLAGRMQLENGHAGGLPASLQFQRCVNC
jgi:hypothetical protein